MKPSQKDLHFCIKVIISVILSATKHCSEQMICLCIRVVAILRYNGVHRML